MARVFIDPGHGGTDNGAQYGFHEEDDYNLAVGFLLDYELRLQGIHTRLSREQDVKVSLAERVAMAQQFQAQAFVSIHYDAWHKKTARGFSTHIYPGATHDLGAHIHHRMRETLPAHRDRGLRESDFFVLRHTPMPAALVECEFITNPETARFLKEPANQRTIARAIAAGILAYLAH